ncbi:MAG: MFS transporter [Proteobacteria bacterium]|nr:MFS transporter [Pseudomonadota bacterium]
MKKFLAILNLKNTRLRGLIFNVYGFSFFNALMLMAPVYTIFIQEHDVSDIRLSVLFIIYSVGVMLFQFPVAWLDRRIGRRNAILVGQAFKAAGIFLLFSAPGYFSFAITMLLWSVQGAAYNVSYEALLYDELKARRHADVYAKVLGRRRALTTVGTMLSAGGSLLLPLGYGFIMAASMATAMIGTWFIMRINMRAGRPVPRERAARAIDFARMMRTGFAVVARTPRILYLLLLCVMLVNISFLDDYLSVIGLEIGLSKNFVGAVAFTAMLFQTLGAAVAYRFRAIGNGALYALISAAGLIFVAFAWFYSVSGLALLGIGYGLFAVLNVLVFARFQDSVPTHHRAIALSLYGAAVNVFYIGILVVFGLGSMIGGWRYSILLLGMMGVLLGIWAALFVGDKCANANRFCNTARFRTLQN